jgi:hypothetical protein
MIMSEAPLVSSRAAFARALSVVTVTETTPEIRTKIVLKLFFILCIGCLKGLLLSAQALMGLYGSS